MTLDPGAAANIRAWLVEHVEQDLAAIERWQLEDPKWRGAEAKASSTFSFVLGAVDALRRFGGIPENALDGVLQAACAPLVEAGYVKIAG